MPYEIVTYRPIPSYHEGKVFVKPFDVSMPIPKLDLLINERTVCCDLNPIYNRTFRAGRWDDLIDYSAEPERFDTYSASDQALIRSIMANMATQADDPS